MTSGVLSFPRVGIVGLGLIGGSMAQLIRQVFPQTEIVAVSTNLDAVSQALATGVITKASVDIADLATMDLVVVATPISVTVETVRRLWKILPAQALITDVASVKSQIEAALSCDLDANTAKAVFIGGHPMAGKETTGYASAEAAMLRGARYVLMPNDAPIRGIFREWLCDLGFHVVDMAADVHDKSVAIASHGPYLMACMAMCRLMTSPLLEDAGLLLSSGFRDTTRVAASAPEWGVSVCLDNASALLPLLRETAEDLQAVIGMIARQDEAGLRRYFEGVSTQRRGLFLS